MIASLGCEGQRPFSIIVNATKLSRVLFAAVIILMMYMSMSLYFTWFIPQSLFIILSLMSIVMYLAFNKLYVTRTRLVASVILTFIFIYEGFVIYEPVILGWVYLLVKILLAVCLIISPTEFQLQILKAVIKCTALIILVSLFFWFLFLVGIPLPHYSTLTGNYYDHTVYYFFLLNGDESQLIYRFAGMFLEPGHVGSTSCLLLFLNGMTPKKWENIVFYIAIILSLSLAAYGLLIGCIILYIMLRKRHAILKIMPFVVLLALLTVFFTNYNDGDNPINEKILLRLVFDNGEMSGSNRTTSLFDAQFDRYIGSSTAIFGMGRKALDTDSSTNIVNGCASWKRYLFLRGYVGFALVLLFLLYYSFSYRTKYGLAFLVVYLVCNAIRDYPIDELWLYLIILSMPLYKQKILA